MESSLRLAIAWTHPSGYLARAMTCHQLLWMVLLVLLLAPFARGDDLGLRVAPGFRATLYSDQDLANDI